MNSLIVQFQKLTFLFWIIKRSWCILLTLLFCFGISIYFHMVDYPMSWVAPAKVYLLAKWIAVSGDRTATTCVADEDHYTIAWYLECIPSSLYLGLQKWFNYKAFFSNNKYYELPQIRDFQPRQWIQSSSYNYDFVHLFCH